MDKKISFDFLSDFNLGAGYTKRPDATHIRHSSMLSTLAYSVTNTGELSAEISSLTQMSDTFDPGSGRYFECGYEREHESDVPVVWMAVMSKELEETKSRRQPVENWVAELYIGFRGSETIDDWLTNCDIRGTASQSSLVRVHTGMFGVFHTSKPLIESLINKYSDGRVLDKVIFTGHSLGGGIAQVCNFEMHAASAPGDWPLQEDWRWSESDETDSDMEEPPFFTVWALTFAAPPVYMPQSELDPIFRTAKTEKCATLGYKEVVAECAENGESVTDEMKKAAKVLDRVRTSNFGFIAEYDLVPRLQHSHFVAEALGSATKQKAESAIDEKPFLRHLKSMKLFVPQVLLMAKDGLMKEAAPRLQHLQHICTLFVLMTMPYPDENWQLVVLRTICEQERFLSTEWPFKGKPTSVAIVDHSLLPHRVQHEWRRARCSNFSFSRKCQHLHRDEVQMVHCQMCSKTFCHGCFGEVHKDKLVKWHPSEQSSLVPVSSSYNTLVESDVQKVLKDVEWFRLWLQKELEGLSGAMNVFWFCDLVKDSTQFLLSGTAPPGLGGAELIIYGGVAAVKSAVVLYQLLYTKTIDSSQFWSELRRIWVEAICAIGGAALGMWIGGVIGALFGPVGVAAGVVVGGMVGGMAGRALGNTMLSHLEGADEAIKDKLRLSMVCKAIHEFGIREAPSEITLKQVTKSFRKLALDRHPDKTGLVGKKNLTKDEERDMKDATERFMKLQHDYEVLDAFVKERDAEPSEWTKAQLQELDDMLPKVREKFGSIDAKREQMRDMALMEIAMG